MCSNQWELIDFNKVSSNAMKRLKKAFAKHEPERFEQWKLKLRTNKPEVKINAKTLQPHELVREIRIKNTADEIIQAQWNVLVEEVKKYGALTDAVVVVDTSGSMTNNDCLPLDVAVAMGLIISETVSGPFQNHVISFNSVPKFMVLPQTDLFSRWKCLRNMEWGGTTNLERTFQLILTRAREFKLTPEDMPKKLFIISDMQFNAVQGGLMTNWENINKMYANYGYTRPQIVFWNVAANTGDFPITVNDTGTTLVSGFSPSILKSLITQTEWTPLNILHEVINDKRYDPIRKELTLDSDFVVV